MDSGHEIELSVELWLAVIVSSLLTLLCIYSDVDDDNTHVGLTAVFQVSLS